MMHPFDNAAMDISSDNNLKSKGVLFATHTGTPGLDRILEHIRSVEWSATSLGNLEAWPPALVQICHLVLLDPQPRLLILGHDRRLFYNESYAALCGDKHPQIFGQTVAEAWGESPEAIEIPLATAESSGREYIVREFPLVYERNGFLEEVFLSWTVMPLVGVTKGFYIALTDVTEERLHERRRATLRALNTAWSVAQNPEKFWQTIPKSLSTDPVLFPFAFVYTTIQDPDSESSIDVAPEPLDGMQFQLEGAVGPSKITSLMPGKLTSDNTINWPNLRKVMASKEPTFVQSCQDSKTNEWPLSSYNTILCPVRSNRSPKVIALLCLGVDAKRPYNDAYEEWANELVRCLGNAATSVISAEEGKRKQHATAKQAAEKQHFLATALATRDKEALAVSDQFQRILKVVDMAGVGIFEFDLEGRLLYSNDAWRAMSGYPEESSSEQKLAFLDLVNSEDREYVMSKWDSMVKGVAVNFEMRWSKSVEPYAKDTSGTWVLAACVPVVDEKGIVKSISGCTTNITAQKRAETESVQRVEALERAKASEQRFVNFAECSPIAVFFGGTNQKLTYCNQAWFSMTGHPLVPTDQVDLQNIVHEEDTQSVVDMWNEITTQQKSMSVQFRLKRRWIDSNGVAIGPVWVVASALPEFNDDGSIKGLIGTMQDISALKFAELIQKAKVDEAIEAKRQQENFIDMTSHEIRNPLGAVVHCSDAVSENLSDMTKLADRLLLTSEHEVGNQLQELINSGVDSIQTVISCSAHQRRIVDDILILSKLDSNLLQIAPSAVQATSLLHDVEKMFEAEAQRNDISVTTESDDSVKNLNVNWAMIDPGRVQQVLINLITNAVKFTKKRDIRKVTIRMGASKDRPSEKTLPVDFVVAHSLHNIMHDAPEFEAHTFYLWFSVKDTGRGMTEEEKGKIFARFTQGSPMTYNEYGGSGLGLFISRELSELQGGEIGVASEIDVGSTFAFFIKTRHTPAPVPAKFELPILTRTHTLSTSSKTNVLVVEDNAVNQRVLKKQLTKHGYDVFVADNGLDALNFIKTSRRWRGQDSSEIDISVILMDVNMPIMDGLTASKKIREFESNGEIYGHIPIIAVSANARAEQTMQAIAAGMDDSIAKPFRIADLVPKIDRLVNWARAS